MGYDLHIFRKEDWSNTDEESNISLQEWLDYVASDNELKLTEGYFIKMPGSENESIPVSGFCIWLDHPEFKDDAAPWFDYRHGSISTKNPDNEVISKMLAIADKLNAKVQGDDGELYDEEYIRSFASFKTEGSNNLQSTATKKPWWKFW